MAPTGTRHPFAAGRLPGVLLFIAGIVLCWSVLPALLQSVPHADNVEQLNWAHALQWGYLKHPPLPTALLWAASTVAGPSAFLTYFLAMACVGASLLLLWRCALLLVDRRAAWVALLLCSANYYLMGRGSFLNHNTVMLPFVAASAWAVLGIVRDTPGRATWPLWLLLGLVQALGLLTKYQMAIVIAANAVALIACGPWRDPGRAALFAGNVPCAPQPRPCPCCRIFSGCGSTTSRASHMPGKTCWPDWRRRSACGMPWVSSRRISAALRPSGLRWDWRSCSRNFAR